MRGQHPGISQPLPRQQSGYDDMQLLQQQLMYRQLQELQRHQQIQIGQEQKQHNSLNHISMLARQATSNQLSTLVNGVPLNDASDCSWQNEFTASDPKTPGNSQMSMAGSQNMAQHGGSSAMRGLMVSHEQGQILRSMGFVSQQSDQFYGMPVSNTRTNQYSPFQGMPQDFADLTVKADANQMQKLSIESASYNPFQNNQNLCSSRSGLQSGILSSKEDMQGKKMFGHATGESVNNNIGGIFQQTNTIGRVSEDQEFNIRHDHPNWSGTLQEKELLPSGTSQVSVGLDPTEQKILFSSDDDVNWGPSFGKSIMGLGNVQGDHLEGDDLFSSVPSFQSGSWSALMQSAVAEVSSGDAGVQDERSGLTFPKVGSSGGSHTVTLNDSAKQQTYLFHHNLPSSSLPSRSGPFENGEQSSKTLHSEKTHIGHPNIEGPWNLQQNMPSYTLNVRAQDKGNGWNVNGPYSPNFGASFRIPVDEGSTEHDSMRTVRTDRDNTVNIWNSDVGQVVASSPLMVGLESSKSGVCLPQMQTAASMNSNSSRGNYELNPHGLYQHEFDYGKHVLDSSQGNENMRNNQQKLNRSPRMWESTVSNSDKISGEFYNKTNEHGPQRELSNDSYISSHSHPDHSSDSVGGARDNFPLSGANTCSFSSGIQQIHGQIGHDMLAQRFNYRPKGDSASEHEMRGSQKHVVHSQGLAQMVARGFKSPEGRSPLQNVTSSPSDTKMKHLNYSQSNAKGAMDMLPERNNGPQYKLSASFEESAVMFPSSSQPSQTGQNMLELLHKVDQSREDDNDATQSSFSDQDTSSRRNESKISEGTVNNLNPAHHDTKTDDQKKTWSSPVVPVQMHNWDLHKFLPRQTAKESSESNLQTDYSMAGKACDLPYVGNQLQQQPGGHTASSHLANMSPRGQYDLNTYNSFSSSQQKNGTNDGSIATSHSPFFAMSGSDSFFMLASPPVSQSIAHSTMLSQSYRVNNHGQSQPVCADSSIKGNSSQQLHAADTGQISQPSLVSGMPQQGGISESPHNVWVNISTGLTNGMPQKTTPVAMQSMNSGKFDACSWISQKANCQDQRNGDSVQPNFGSFACNPPNVNHDKEHSAKVRLKQQAALARADSTSDNANSPQGQESVPNQSSGATSFLPNTSSVHLHEKEKHGKCSFDKCSSQTDQSAEMNASPYSLLHQMQAMKAFEANRNNRASKRQKGTESGLDSQQLTGKTLRCYGSNKVGKGQGDDLSAVVHHSSFPPDSKMLSFSSDGAEQQNPSKPQVVGKEINQDLGTSWHSVSQNYPHSVSLAPSKGSSGGVTDHQPAMFNPQMTPSWFEHYGNLRKSNVPSMFGRHSDNSQNATIIAEHYSKPQVPESMSTQYVLERKRDATTVLSNQLASLQELSSGASEHDVNRPKKRKSATYDLLPWHREVMVGSDRLQNIRMAERDWGQATNRLVEKVENRVDFSYDGHVMPRTRRRLILTTQLMQQLLPSVPAAMLSKPVSTAYESITYLVAKLSLGDACGLVSCLRMDTCGQLDGENRISGKSKASDGPRDQFFLELVENFVGRARKLENELNRSEKKASLLDIKMECQELEKIAVINRFAECHVRNQMNGESSTSETSRSTFIHRYVTAHSVSANVPEGVLCLSL